MQGSMLQLRHAVEVLGAAPANGTPLRAELYGDRTIEPGRECSGSSAPEPGPGDQILYEHANL